jgi:predicted nucleotidyltransferase
MNNASAYLQRLARQVITPYTEHPQIRAIILTGSAADGSADLHSDLDLIAYYDELPTDTALAAARQHNKGQNFSWLFNERDNGSIAEAYDVHGVQCQIMHNTIAAWEGQMDTVLVRHEVATPLHKAMSGIQKAIPLYGVELIQRWQERVADFPETLARATVEHHLHFFPLWGLQHYMDSRDAVLWRYQSLLEAAQNILGVLAGLNRLYYTTFQFKRMRLFTKQLLIAPDNLDTRLEQLFVSEPHTAAADLERLVEELVELVEQQMPTVDTSSVRKRLGWRRPEWQILSDDRS